SCSCNSVLKSLSCRSDSPMSPICGSKKGQHDAAGLIDSKIEKDRAGHSFESIDQQGLFRTASRLFLPPSQVQIITQLQPFRVFHQIGGTDEETLQLRKLAFGKLRVRPIQKITDQKTEDRIA